MLQQTTRDWDKSVEVKQQVIYYFSRTPVLQISIKLTHRKFGTRQKKHYTSGRIFLSGVREINIFLRLNVPRDTVRCDIYWTGVEQSQKPNRVRPLSIGLASSSFWINWTIMLENPIFPKILQNAKKIYYVYW